MSVRVVNCAHMYTRAARGDAALVDPEVIREDIPALRAAVPEYVQYTDEEIIVRVTIILASIPRHCPICAGFQSSS